MKKLKKIRPSGHRVLVMPDPVEEVSKGGIILDTGDKSKRSREQHGQFTGTIVDIGPDAWDIHNGEPWAKVGDRILFAQHGGFPVEVDGKLHRVINDEDVTAIIDKEEVE